MADIQPGGRFVEQHNRRFLRQHHRNPCALALSTGKGIHTLRRKMSDSRRLHRCVYRDFILISPAGKQWLMRVAPTGNQLLYRNITRRGGVLRQQTYSASNLFAGIVLDMLAVEPDLTVRGRHQTTKRAQ